ncbi:MAG: chromosome segregation protein SMC [Deltaproteobacteria bacterium HGW-Deltaproteobacteria-15]|jgi:chromosome segregation protein|nr:MAG: chromosome segregation protein SMC [Deltaproteobacteria bacterium HGW-Deltaproteobacteria-15]
MKIKKLAVTGFKSFTDKVEVPFSLGLSAIVGPNGCGKSNLVDAIRWAMGEQSAKLLRGRQMEDVIFCGTDGCKPMGMAEVSLIFENGDGSFPPQFADRSEISVTRRLYRSGESEYLINNVPCRLKDIQEIFMDTGLGNRAYSIIGQGKIGAIVEQRPEETRAMVEEAAGITKYKKKVEESQRKIESAKSNLQRVEDILGEVMKQMRSFKRQAAKARRYKVISEDIQNLELSLAANSYNGFKVEVENSTRSIDELNQEEVVRSAGFSRIQAGTETLKLELEEKESEISVVRGKFLQAKERVGKKESFLESLIGEKRMQVEMEARLEREKQELRKKQEDLGFEREGLLQKIAKARESASCLEEECSLLDKRVRGRLEFLKQVKEVYEEARTRVNAGMSKEMSLNQESGYIHKRMGELTTGRARLEKEGTDLKTRAEEILRASEKKNQVREALVLKLRDIEADLSSSQELCKSLEEKKSGLEKELVSLEGSLNGCQSRLTSLKALSENYEGYKVGVRTIMKSEDLGPKKDGRVIGLVADLIKVDSRYEQAVEAVLADRLQSVVVESQEDGREAVTYLRDRAKGRSSFVPLKDLNQEIACGKLNGFPLLRHMVEVPDQYRSMIDLLLSDAAVVENLDQAISAWREHGKNRCLVTVDGDMIDSSGIITGGKLAHTSHGILARKREIKELEAEVVLYREKTGGLRNELLAVAAKIEEKRKSVSDLTEERWNCQEQINDLDKVIFQISHELDQIEKLSSRIGEELAQKNKEEDRQREALSKIASELDRCRQRRQEEDAYLHEKEAELRESEEEAERFRDELAKAKMNLGLAREEEKGFKREVDRIDLFSKDAGEGFKRIEQDILSSRDRYSQCERQEESLREELSALSSALQAAQEAVQKEERDRDELRARVREEEKKAEELRSEWESLKEKIHAARMEHSEIGFRMNNLVEMVRDKFNLNLSEIYSGYVSEDFSAPETKQRLEHRKMVREKLGEVNLTAIQEHAALKERLAFMTAQKEDLLKSIDSLQEAIRRINKTSLDKFMETFEEIDKRLKTVFPILFNGGSASLRLTDPSKPLESGVLVEVKPPGKRLSHMGLLSGGEKALVAMALLFAIYLIKPSPFCLLDEVDAPLDEANIDRYNNLLTEIGKYSQIILITHNRRSMEIVDRLYGVTMEKQGVSKIVSVNLEGFQGN